MGMILNCIWWFGLTSGDLRSVEYPFIGFTSRSTNLDLLGSHVWVKYFYLKIICFK